MRGYEMVDWTLIHLPRLLYLQGKQTRGVSSSNAPPMIKLDYRKWDKRVINADICSIGVKVV